MVWKRNSTSVKRLVSSTRTWMWNGCRKSEDGAGFFLNPKAPWMGWMPPRLLKKGGFICWILPQKNYLILTPSLKVRTWQKTLHQALQVPFLFGGILVIFFCTMQGHFETFSDQISSFCNIFWWFSLLCLLPKRKCWRGGDNLGVTIWQGVWLRVLRLWMGRLWFSGWWAFVRTLNQEMSRGKKSGFLLLLF